MATICCAVPPAPFGPRPVIAEKEKSGSEPALAEAKKRLAELEAEDNVLEFSRAKLQAFRGKSVSMIFQEPMSALNPVFTAGFQISEVLLLHERADLAKAVLRQMDARVKEIDAQRRRISLAHSDEAAMDESARMAVLRAAPLQRLPEGYDGSYLGVRFWFTYLGN